MANPQLVGYVQECLMSGMSLNQAAVNLIAAGWPLPDVNEAVNYVTQGSWPGQTFSKPLSQVRTEVVKEQKHRTLTLAIILVILVIGAVAVYFLLRPPCAEDWSCTAWSECTDRFQVRTCNDLNSCGTEKERPSLNQNCGTTTTTLQQSTGPEAVYLQYKAEFDSAINFTQFMEVMKKYGSAKQVNNTRQAEGLSDALRENVFNMVKSVAPAASKIANITESIAGDTATLRVTLKDGSQGGNVTLVKENGIWKIDEEAWKSK
jgi:hypothetical protein